jgi:hypothetical protein
MTEMKALIFAAALCAATCFSGTARSQTTTAKPPTPSQICVNAQCSKTTTAATTAPAATGSIKWNPGHYMASDSTMSKGRTVSFFQSEMQDINNQDAVVGYRVYVTWGALETTQGTYDFSQIDAMIAQLKTAYNKPKHLVIGLQLYGMTGLGNNDGSVFPLYIQQNVATYGASPVSGSSGWWGKNANGASTGMYAPALYYPPVMDRLIALVQALGKHLDGEPYFEGLIFQENSTIAQAASTLGTVDPHYSDEAWLTQQQRFLTAATAAFPHTSIIMQNSWFDKPQPAVTLQQWMATNRIAPGTADSWGQSAINTYGTSHLSDGIQTLLGVSQYGGTTDLRPKTRAMIDVQSPDIAGPYFQGYGGPWAPVDIVNAANQTYQASHVFWTHLVGTETVFGGSVPAVAKWSNLAPVLAKNPLTNTGYPANYP